VKRFFWIALGLGAVGLAVAWPHVNDVETGRSPEYPDLKVREYRAGVEDVSRAVQKVLKRLPRWEFVGAGSGPRGAEIRAVHTALILRIRDEVTVRVSSAGGRTHLSVRSRSESLPWDFGQNARNIREFLESLDDAVS
jgi:hypothetical protein